MARTRWPPGPGNPGLLSRPGRSDRQRRWVPQKPGARPTDRFSRQPERRQPIRRSGRDPGHRPYAPARSKPGKQGRKHHPHPPCRFSALWGRDPQVGGMLRSSRYARRPNPGGGAGLVCGASGSFWPAWVMWSSTLMWSTAAAGTGRERGRYARARRQDLPAGGCRFAGRCPPCGAARRHPSVLLPQCGERSC